MENTTVSMETEFSRIVMTAFLFYVNFPFEPVNICQYDGYVQRYAAKRELSYMYYV